MKDITGTDNNLNFQTMDGKLFEPIVNNPEKPVLILFYHTDCLGCTGRALPLAYQLSREFPDIQLVVVHVQFKSRPVSHDDILAVFTDKTPPFPIYLDENAAMYTKYEAEGTPHWLIFDSNGRLAHSIFGSMEGAQNRLYYALEEVVQNKNPS